MIKPPVLKKGDTIGVISPASPSESKSEIIRAQETLEDMGYKVVIGKNVNKQKGFVAASEDERAWDLNYMFKNDGIDAVFVTQGGYGSAQILDKIDYEAIKKSPKIFTGFSDITSLHLAMNKFSNLMTFHGPGMARFNSEDLTEYTKKQFFKAIAGTAPNVIPGSCKVWMSNGRQIQTFGKAAHSSRPERGKNAILLMAEKIASEEFSGDTIAEKMVMIQKRFHDIYGSGIGIYSKNEYYNGEYIHRNVVSPTMIRTEKGYLELTLNVRFSYESTAEEIIAAIEKLCDEEGGYVDSCTSLPAIYVDRHEPYLEKLAKAYEDQTDFSNEFSLAYGGSYAKVMKRMVSWGPILPGMEDTCHEENECIKIDDLLTNFRIYYDAIMSIAKSEESFV